MAVAACVISLGVYALWPTRPPPAGKADRVVVIKSQRTLLLMRGDQVLKSYKVALGRQSVGPKVHEGDHRTPEGNYVLDSRNPQSRFHLSFHVSYPNASDITRARGLGETPGGNIMIHGIANGLGWIGRLHRLWDWTDGCIAVTNSDIEEIWRAVPDGTRIEIRP